MTSADANRPYEMRASMPDNASWAMVSSARKSTCRLGWRARKRGRAGTSQHSATDNSLLITSFHGTDAFTSEVTSAFTTDNYHKLFTQSVYRAVTVRTLGIAVAVTVVDALIALPMAFYIAKLASVRARRLLMALVVTPLWASYLVKAYAWRTMLAQDGVLNWLLQPFGGHGPGFGVVATTLTLAYLWLPYMILPVVTGLERIPNSLLEASSDLGARAGTTLRSVVLPMLFPSIVAGSIFTFSLTLGDYITVKIVGGSTQMIANVIRADGHLHDAELALFRHVLERWHLTLDQLKGIVRMA